jgi:hypothetical protein
VDADCSLAASLLALDSEAAWELPELLSLLELLWEAELLSPESAWDELVLWEELAVPLEAEAEPAGEAVLSLLEEL